MRTRKSTTTPAIRLTPEQQEQLRQATGKEVSLLKLEALDPRLAPGLQLN